MSRTKTIAAREILQTAASGIRSLALAGEYSPELVNAAAQVEAIFDSLYPARTVADEPAPQTRRSA